jgi:hypothetical protein
MFAANIASFPALLRHLDQFTGRKVSRSLRGQQLSPTTLMFDVLSGQAKHPQRTALRSMLAPFAPVSTAKEKQNAQLSTLLQRKYATVSDIGVALDAMGKAKKQGDESQVIANARTALLAINAKKVLDKEANRLGIAQSQSWKTGWSAGVSAQTGQITIPLSRTKILDDLDRAGIRYPNVPPFRARKVRRINP